MSDMQISQVLAQMRALAQNAGVAEAAPQGSPTTDFANLLKQSIDQVNQTQQASRTLVTAFETGDPSVSLVDVMVASQKSSVAFEAAVQVRNRLLTAYQEIMRMPI
jgi:flagellar hook-basal body complex protein FliE